MKVLICCLNSKYIHASLAPWCLAAGVKAYGKAPCNVKVTESTINKPVSDFVEKIVSEKPQVVSFSCYIWNIEKTLEVCKAVKERTDAVTVLGGPEVAYRAEAVLQKYNFVDYVLSGEGEESYPALLDAVYFNSSLECVNGLTYRKEGEIIVVPEKTYEGTPPSPYSEEFFENLGGRISYIETGRGCPYRCAFCLSGRCSSLRFFDMEKVKADIIRLANSGTKIVKFVDRTFNADYKRANEIFNFIISNSGVLFPENVCFHFEIAGDILKEDTFKILESAPKGLFQLEIGMQSFNEDTLKAINRKTDSKRLIENIKRLVTFGNMHIHIDLIAGLTGEDITSFERSFDIGYSLGANMLQMGFLKLLYGADMRENPEKYPCSYNEKPPYEVTETPWLSKEDVLKLKKTEDALERLYNSGRFLFTLNFLINETGFTPFKLFSAFGEYVDGANMNLSDYALKVYEFFSEYTDRELLREKLICDLLSCSSALQIPEILKIKDPLYKKIKKHFASGKEGLYKIAVLYKSGKVFVVNQRSKKDFSGRYSYEFFDLDEFIKD